MWDEMWDMWINSHGFDSWDNQVVKWIVYLVRGRWTNHCNYRKDFYKFVQDGAPKIAFSWFVTIVTIVYDTYTYMWPFQELEMYLPAMYQECTH